MTRNWIAADGARKDGQCAARSKSLVVLTSVHHGYLRIAAVCVA